MNEVFGKDFYKKGNSAKSFGPFTEPPDSESEKLLSSSPSRKSALIGFPCRKNPFLPGAHKIGAAISGPRITGKTIYGHEDFLN